MIIGLTGKIGSGKSTMAKYLVKKYGFIEYSFAGPLKRIGKIFGFNKRQLYGTQQQKMEINSFWKTSARRFLQVVGTELFRNHLKENLPEMRTSGSVWIDLFLKTFLEKPGNYVISDVRFLNEETVLKAMGAVIIKCKRRVKKPNKFLVSEKSTKKVSQHPSETEMDKIIPDYILDNNCSRKKSYKNLTTFLRNSGKKNVKN